MKLARQETALMLGVGQALHSSLEQLGRDAHARVLQQANREGVPSDYLPYLFWILDRDEGLPPMQKDERRAFELLLSIWQRTGTMPDYKRGFRVPEGMEVDLAVNAVVSSLAQWALREMVPRVRQAYQAALASQKAKVPRATGGKVSPKQSLLFLERAFPQLLLSHSRIFQDGVLLRQALRALGM